MLRDGMVRRSTALSYHCSATESSYSTWRPLEVRMVLRGCYGVSFCCLRFGEEGPGGWFCVGRRDRFQLVCITVCRPLWEIVWVLQMESRVL
jgi:hypothetical protein